MSDMGRRELTSAPSELFGRRRRPARSRLARGFPAVLNRSSDCYVGEAGLPYFFRFQNVAAVENHAVGKLGGELTIIGALVRVPLRHDHQRVRAAHSVV